MALIKKDGLTKIAYSDILGELTDRWNRKLQFVSLLNSLSITMIMAAAIARFTQISAKNQIALDLGVFLFLVLVSAVISGQRKLSANKIARHLNREFPELEESCELLISKTGVLSVIETLQMRRVEKSFDQIKDRITIHAKGFGMAFGNLAIALVISAILNLLPSDLLQNVSRAGMPAPYDGVQSSQVENEIEPITIISTSVQVTPPEYTGLSRRETDQLNLQIAQGSLLDWQFRTNQQLENAWIIFNDQDTIHMSKAAEDDVFSYEKTITENAFYTFILHSKSDQRMTTDYYSIDVTEDLNPRISVSSPSQRTFISYGQKPHVLIDAKADDDYGLGEARLVATVTSGSGESVRFRDMTFTFDLVKEISPKTSVLQKTLDLTSLEMKPGNELYFHLVVADNRRPVANLSRSETFFVVLEDTADSPPLVSAGIAINPIPAYFRSQRQIILDTEKLVSEKDKLKPDEFERRANNLGIDQKSLRLRYGQFLGEESDEVNLDPFETTDPDFQQETDPDQRPDSEKDEEQTIIDSFGHSHDSAENATLFAESIKNQLKAALAEMWDAELNLRTYKPEAALPFEYRALVLLKRVQQRSRIFVQRVGFEPPPLEPKKKRLSGDLSKIKNRTTGLFRDSNRPFPAISSAIHVLQKFRHLNSAPGDDTISLLESAGDEMAAVAVREPARYLEALRDLRNLISSFGSSSDFCHECIDSIEKAFWNILPDASALPRRDHAWRSEIFEAYFKMLEAR